MERVLVGVDARLDVAVLVTVVISVRLPEKVAVEVTV